VSAKFQKLTRLQSGVEFTTSEKRPINSTSVLNAIKSTETQLLNTILLQKAGFEYKNF